MKNTTRIGVVLLLSAAFFITEIAVGFKTRSLALIADAFHYLNDIVAYVIAFIAAYTHKFTFAFHRAELVGAFFNGVFLLALALSILLQSIERFVHVEVVDDPKLVIIVGCVGLALNICSIFFVHDHSHGHGGHGHGHGHGHGDAPAQSNSAIQLTEPTAPRDLIHATHNHHLEPQAAAPQHNLGLLGVLIHVIGDAVNNIGVIIAGTLIFKLGSPNRYYADPAVSLAIAFIIFGSAIPMTFKSGRILLESSPIHLDLTKVKEDLVSIPLVKSVHDLHVWHLSQSVILASLHVCVPAGTTLEQWEKTERYLQHCFEEYGISHVTISPEIERDSTSSTRFSSTEDLDVGCGVPHDAFGCAVSDLKKRKPKVSA